MIVEVPAVYALGALGQDCTDDPALCSFAAEPAPVQGPTQLTTLPPQVMPAQPPSTVPGLNIPETIAASGAAAAQAIRAATPPYVIPGTNVLYNPGTGQMGSPYAVSGSMLASSIGTSIGPIAMLGFGLLVIFMMMGRK